MVDEGHPGKVVIIIIIIIIIIVIVIVSYYYYYYCLLADFIVHWANVFKSEIINTISFHNYPIRRLISLRMFKLKQVPQTSFNEILRLTILPTLFPVNEQ